MIEAVLASFLRVKGLKDCRLIIVCDGPAHGHLRDFLGLKLESYKMILNLNEYSEQPKLRMPADPRGAYFGRKKSPYSGYGYFFLLPKPRACAEICLRKVPVLKSPRTRP